MGAFHAANFALRRGDLFPRALCLSGNYDPSSWHGWGERGDALYFQNPSAYVAGPARRAPGLAAPQVHLVLVCGQGMWEDTTGALRQHPRARRRCWPRRTSRTSWTCGATTWRTTGRGGGASSPTTCTGCAEGGADVEPTPGRAAARHRGGLARGLRDDHAPDGPGAGRRGEEHGFDVERITIEPFDLRYRPRYDLVIDRLAYWYYVPREWLKKVALMDDVYLLNSPFTFQSMEKHAAYCAMMRLGLKVPDTVLVPYKNPPEHAKWAYTAARYNQPFDLDAIAERMGYPLFMKPYDGGAWVGVTRIKDRDRPARGLRRVRASG